VTRTAETGATSGATSGAAAAWRQVLGSSRPVSWVNTAYPFAAAYLMAGGAGRVGVPELVVGTLYFLVPYNLLMYGLNDVWDYESDLRNPRKGGIEGVVLSRRWHRLTVRSAVLSNVPFLVYLVLVGGAASTAVLAVSVFAVVAYSAPGLRFKERPVLDSATSSTHFVSPAVFGLVLAGGTLDGPVLAALAGFFLWGMASQAFGAVQDVEADRAAAIGSVATWLGAARTVRAATALYVAAGLVLLLGGTPVAWAAVLVVPYVASIAPYRSLPDSRCEEAHAGWRRFLWLNLVTGFLVTQLLIAVAMGWL
jgi:4-hydroxybenzoate polyprenyltransferase